MMYRRVNNVTVRNTASSTTTRQSYSSTSARTQKDLRAFSSSGRTTKSAPLNATRTKTTAKLPTYKANVIKSFAFSLTASSNNASVKYFRTTKLARSNTNQPNEENKDKKQEEVTETQLLRQETEEERAEREAREREAAAQEEAQQEREPTREEILQAAVIPRGIKIGGVLSAAPLILGAVAADTLPAQEAGMALFLQMTYGASVMSLLGGVYWGLLVTKYAQEAEITTQQKALCYTLGSLPPVLSWISFSQGPFEGMLFLLGGYAAIFLGDVMAEKWGVVPAWYLKFKIPYTVTCVAALGASFIQVL